MKYVRLLRDIYHYVRGGYKFDKEFYLDTNPDLIGLDAPFKHYIIYGRKEGRYCCEKQLYDNHIKPEKYRTKKTKKQ